MKKIMIFSIMLIINSFVLFAQAPPVPPSSANQGGTGPVGGGAPVGSGMVLLISLAAGYGGKKVFNARKSLAE